MWKADYGKEPFDLRLLLFRIWKKLPVLLGLCILVTGILGGAYYVKNIVLRPEKTYVAASIYEIEFSSPTWAMEGTYINETTWNTWVHTDEFIGNVKKHLQEADGGVQVTEAELQAALSAKLASDLRMPSTYVVTNDPAKSEKIAAAVELAMVQEMVEGSDAIATMRVVDYGKAQEVLWDVRPKRAFILSAVLSVLFVFGIFLLLEIGDDSIWLPITLKTRYGLTPVGTVESAMCKENLKYLFGDKTKVAICPAFEEIDPMQVERSLNALLDTPMQWVSYPNPNLSPESAEHLRQADAVLLVVSAGTKVGKPLEAVLAFLGTQDIAVTGALLWEADEKLIRNYYRFQKKDC